MATELVDLKNGPVVYLALDTLKELGLVPADFTVGEELEIEAIVKVAGLEAEGGARLQIVQMCFEEETAADHAKEIYGAEDAE